jgi:hypothetical protein
VLTLRQAEIIPRLRGAGNSGRYEVLDDAAVLVRWTLGDRSELVLAANLKSSSLSGIDLPRGRVLWSEGSAEDRQLGRWSVLWTLSGG